MKRMWSRQGLLAWLLGAISAGQVPTGTKLYKHKVSFTDDFNREFEIKIVDNNQTAITEETLSNRVGKSISINGLCSPSGEEPYSIFANGQVGYLANKVGASAIAELEIEYPTSSFTDVVEAL